MLRLILAWNRFLEITSCACLPVLSLSSDCLHPFRYQNHLNYLGTGHRGPEPLAERQAHGSLGWTRVPLGLGQPISPPAMSPADSVQGTLSSGDPAAPCSKPLSPCVIVSGVLLHLLGWNQFKSSGPRPHAQVCFQILEESVSFQIWGSVPRSADSGSSVQGCTGHCRPHTPGVLP